MNRSFSQSLHIIHAPQPSQKQHSCDYLNVLFPAEKNWQLGRGLTSSTSCRSTDGSVVGAPSFVQTQWTSFWILVKILKFPKIQNMSGRIKVKCVYVWNFTFQQTCVCESPEFEHFQNLSVIRTEHVFLTSRGKSIYSPVSKSLSANWHDSLEPAGHLEVLHFLQWLRELKQKQGEERKSYRSFVAMPEGPTLWSNSLNYRMDWHDVSYIHGTQRMNPKDLKVHVEHYTR